MNNAQNQSRKKYYEQQRKDILPYVPLGISTLLDVGCGAGIFGKEVKKSLSAEVWGVELNEDMAEKASIHLDKVLKGSILFNMKEIPSNYFDCITLNDVLEHIVDYEQTLLEIRKKLKPDGIIICSVPNVRYAGNLSRLIFSKTWDYQSCGIMDNTHVRFFTIKSLSKTLSRLNFKINKIGGINPPIFSLEQTWKNMALPILCWGVSILSLGYFDDVRYVQILAIMQKNDSTS